MIGHLNAKSLSTSGRAELPSPRVLLFSIWMLGWAFGLLLATTSAGSGPVMVAYLLVMLTSGVWAVGLSLLPHLPRIPASRRLMPKPLHVRVPREPRSSVHDDPCAELAESCYYLCSDGELVPITDREVLRAIDESDREMRRRQ